MKKIKLTKEKFAIVDDEDFEFLNQWKWGISSHGYAVRHELKNEQMDSNKHKKIIYMHRIVNKTPLGKITDHINRDTLDNRKKNLRTTNKAGNSINRGLQDNNTSGFKGISWNKRCKKWETYIWNNQTRIRLGDFKVIQDAIFIRKQAELKYHVI